jgi:thioredoxin
MSVNLVRSVTSAEFDVILRESDRPLVVDFWAAWCGPCRRLKPVFGQVAGEMSDRAQFLAVDVDAEPGLAERHGIVTIPTIVVFDAGRPVGSLTGAVSPAHLTSMLDAWLLGASMRS